MTLINNTDKHKLCELVISVTAQLTGQREAEKPSMAIITPSGMKVTMCSPSRASLYNARRILRACTAAGWLHTHNTHTHDYHMTSDKQSSIHLSREAASSSLVLAIVSRVCIVSLVQE